MCCQVVAKQAWNRGFSCLVEVLRRRVAKPINDRAVAWAIRWFPALKGVRTVEFAIGVEVNAMPHLDIMPPSRTLFYKSGEEPFKYIASMVAV